jgi:hypothetical protein
MYPLYRRLSTQRVGTFVPLLPKPRNVPRQCQAEVILHVIFDKGDQHPVPEHLVGVPRRSTVRQAVSLK